MTRVMEKQNRSCNNRRPWLAWLLALSSLTSTLAAEDNGRIWKSLAEDGIHDPANPGIELLQQPGDALSALPGDTAGNQVDWIEALAEGFITPRAKIEPSTEVRIRSQDIIFGDTSDMRMVRFPHRQHTEWLDCKNCHEGIFISEAGANEFGMFDILAGEFCGRCHGAVSFPLTECTRCHSVDRATFTGKLGAQPLLEDKDVNALVRPEGYE